MQLKKKLHRARLQLYYSKRAQTMPLFSTKPTFWNRCSTKTIKSLNLYCLAEIFDYLDYKDLSNCRAVCAYWKECVDFHLVRRTHFSYGKIYNNVRLKNHSSSLKSAPVFEENDALISSYSCEKCSMINQKIQHDASSSFYCRSSKSSSPSDFDELAYHSPSFSLSPINLTPSISPINSNYSDYEYRCNECQSIIKELQQQLEQQIHNTGAVADDNNDEDDGDDHQSIESAEDFYSGFIDNINIEMFESILQKMPRLTTLKFAQGYNYGRLRQSCLEVSGVNLLQRTFQYCPHLTRIDLSNCIGLAEKDFVQLTELYGKKLVALNLSGCRIDEACLRVIVKGNDRLRYLNIANNFCRLQGSCFEWLADTIETVVADYNQNVRVLDGLLQGKGRNVIELELNVGYCFNPIMPYKLIGNNFQDLISLKITFKSFGKRKNGIFVNLSQLKELECLYLIEEIDDFDSESSLDDDSVLAIMESCGSRLRELYLHAASSLFGRESPLTDLAIANIHQLCPQLDVFSIKRASITDVSLDSIAQLKNAYKVELIDLEKITEDGIKRIMSSFKQIEAQEMEKIKETSGIDLTVGQNGPKIEKMKRHSSFSNEISL